ncbi:hypothetical protein JCM19275_1072 [Nonlabens ulvanivorans]|uniref:DUF6705 domain-containing protein n=1 Tax=Nonlabens ulvanivorans TaxID=906888 RepID=A0A090WFR7_NONUL|nr:DUF6705 family protein [Nonlabens ulvanivorans]GAL75033.1 hypothetical protein JCM19275_1072 [Nonlabens ulvanivorans]
MKKIFLLSIAFISVLEGLAQDNIIPLEQFSAESISLNDYYKDVNGVLDKFVGTWIYDDGTTYFKVVFQKKERNSAINDWDNTPIYFDQLVANFELKLNGVTVYNNLNSTDNYLIHDGHRLYNLNRKIKLFYSESDNIYTDSYYNNYGLHRSTLELTYQPDLTNNIDQLFWNRITFNGKELIDTSNYLIGQQDSTPYQIPPNMLLTKQ